MFSINAVANWEHFRTVGVRFARMVTARPDFISPRNQEDPTLFSPGLIAARSPSQARGVLEGGGKKALAPTV